MRTEGTLRPGKPFASLVEHLEAGGEEPRGDHRVANRRELLERPPIREEHLAGAVEDDDRHLERVEEAVEGDAGGVRR